MVTVSSITSNGITWSFASQLTAGQYINGDWWVLGPAMVSSISPSSQLRSDTSVKNGSVIADTLNLNYQGFDSGLEYHLPYSSILNVGLDINESAPLILNTGQRLLSVSARDLYPPIQTAGVLTCVSSTVPDNCFRPGYTDQTKDYIPASSFLTFYQNRIGNVDASALLTGAPTYNSIVGSLSGFWLDCFSGFNAAEFRPINSMPYKDYGIASAISDAALSINYNSGFDKSSIAVHIIQKGIDNYSNLVNLGSSWSDRGYIGTGKKFPILFAGVMLDDIDMGNIGINYPVVYGGPNPFAEDMETFIVSSISGSINQGYGSYATSDIGVPEWGNSHWNSVIYDTSSWVNATSYGNDARRVFTMENWLGFLMASKIMGLGSLWNHSPLFLYFNRYILKEHELEASYSDYEITVEPTWVDTIVDSYNSEYFPTDSSRQVSGVEYHGISSRSNILLYTSANPPTASAAHAVLYVTNPVLAGSGLVLIGQHLRSGFVDSDGSGILYVEPTRNSAVTLISSTSTLDTYTYSNSSGDEYVQVVWLDPTTYKILGSSNAIRIVAGRVY
jgi:hypothetical protein